MSSPPKNGAHQLRRLLASGRFLTMPCCFDAFSVRLVELAGFPLTFMSGFAVAASRLASPDTGLISFAEMAEQGRSITGAVSIPVIGDGDTGYGNAVNVKRTVREYARVGFAGVMIEDQRMPKRCGHVAGKQVVEREEAVTRIRAAVDAREEGADILVMARTDARATHGLEEALWRVAAFSGQGADIIFVEAPESVAEMERICRETPGITMANMLERGRTPVLPPARLAEIGYTIAAYPCLTTGAPVGAVLRACALRRPHEPRHISRSPRPSCRNRGCCDSRPP